MIMSALKIYILSILIPFTFLFSDIIGSKHDLSSRSENTIRAAGDTSYICVFCHTPHSSNSNYSDIPIWNKQTNTQTYTTYGTTLGGTTSSNTISNISKACLSCHDGVSAINSILNAPGSGLGGLVSMNGVSTGTEVKMPAGSSNLGLDLSKIHPVSIEYKARSGSLKAASSDLGTGWKTSDGLNKVSSLLKNNKVECISCHDPHLGENVAFLRSGNNTGSKLCLGCHDK